MLVKKQTVRAVCFTLWSTVKIYHRLPISCFCHLFCCLSLSMRMKRLQRNLRYQVLCPWFKTAIALESPIVHMVSMWYIDVGIEEVLYFSPSYLWLIHILHRPSSEVWHVYVGEVAHHSGICLGRNWGWRVFHHEI